MKAKKSAGFGNGAVRLTLMFVISAAICLAAGIIYKMRSEDMRTGFIESTAAEQMGFTETAAGIISNAADIDEAVKIISDMKCDSSHYWFLLSESMVLYENGTKYSDLELSSAAKKYIASGAERNAIMSYLGKIQEGKNFSVLVTKDISTGCELITVAFAQLDGKSYAVGYSVRESYILSLSELNSNILSLGILIGVLCLLFTVLCCGNGIITYTLRRKLKYTDKELVRKNRMVQEQGERLVQSAQNITEEETHTEDDIYSISFMRAFLKKLYERDISNAGAVAVRLDAGITDYLENDAYGYVHTAAAAIMKKAGERCVCAKLRSDMLILICVDSDVNVEAENAAEALDKLKLKYKIGVCPPQDDIYSCCDKAIKEADEHRSAVK